MSRDDDYLAHRALLVRLGYDITGSWADAEDVAQQAYVRFRSVATEVADARAYLARIATNLALDVVARRPPYVGPDLPEPIPTGPGADEAVAQAAEVEIALMVVLRSLTAVERAVFLLHDVFAFDHAEIARMLDREPASVRQTNVRARKHVEARRPLSVVSDEVLGRLTETFLAAAQRGDVDALTAMLTDDVVFVGDGGGRVSTARRPVIGAEKVARLLVGLVRNLDEASQVEPVRANGRLAVRIWQGDQLDQVSWLLTSEDGRVAQILIVRNPDKLAVMRSGRMER